MTCVVFTYDYNTQANFTELNHVIYNMIHGSNAWKASKCSAPDP